MRIDKSRKSYDDVLNILADERGDREDISCSAGDMTPTLNADGEFVLRYVDGREFIPTPHAMNHASKWYGAIPQTFVNWLMGDVHKQSGKLDYSRDYHDAELLVNAFEVAGRHLDSDKQMLFRTYNDGTLRAMLTESYDIVDNEWYIGLIREIFPDAEWGRFRGNADTINGYLILDEPAINPDGKSDVYQALSISNCEIGTRRVSQGAGMFRLICTNGLMSFDAFESGIKKVHKGIDSLESLAKTIRANINKQLGFTSIVAERMEESRTVEIPKDVRLTKVLATIAQNANTRLTLEELNRVTVEFGSNKCERNLWGVVDAITRASQEFDESEKLDLIGGRLIDDGRDEFERTIIRARNMSDAEHDKIYRIKSTAA